MKQTDSCGCSKSDMRIISLWLAAVFITFWLIALSWLAVILYGEIKKMDTAIKSGKCIIVCLCLMPNMLLLLLLRYWRSDMTNNSDRWNCFMPLLFWNWYRPKFEQSILLNNKLINLIQSISLYVLCHVHLDCLIASYKLMLIDLIYLSNLDLYFM